MVVDVAAARSVEERDVLSGEFRGLQGPGSGLARWVGRWGVGGVGLWHARVERLVGVVGGLRSMRVSESVITVTRDKMMGDVPHLLIDSLQRLDLLYLAPRSASTAHKAHITIPSSAH